MCKIPKTSVFFLNTDFFFQAEYTFCGVGDIDIYQIPCIEVNSTLSDFA